MSKTNYLRTGIIFLKISIIIIATNVIAQGGPTGPAVVNLGQKFYLIASSNGDNSSAACVDGQTYTQFSYHGTTHQVPAGYPSIQEAIDGVADGDTILVSSGTYIEDILFKPGKTVYVYGENGPENTIIQGTGNGSVITFSLENESVLSGFTITNGSTQASGGGITCYDSSRPTVKNCVITGNTAMVGGGGIHCASNSVPIIEGCVIIHNSTTGGTGQANGGGIHIADSAHPSIISCVISNNSSSYHGGAIAINNANIYLVNSTITNNSSTKNGGAISAQSSLIRIFNCTFSGNQAGNENSWGGALALTSPTADSMISNSILWGDYNSAGVNEIALIEGGTMQNITYCNIQGGYEGEGNIDQDPRFTGQDDYHLQNDSPCIDTASSQHAPQKDIDGDCRPRKEGYDMGSDEVL